MCIPRLSWENPLSIMHRICYLPVSTLSRVAKVRSFNCKSRHIVLIGACIGNHSVFVVLDLVEWRSFLFRPAVLGHLVASQGQLLRNAVVWFFMKPLESPSSGFDQQFLCYLRRFQIASILSGVRVKRGNKQSEMKFYLYGHSPRSWACNPMQERSSTSLL